MATMTGSNGSDILIGTASNDIINSGNGDDIVNGGAGSDSLNGGAGNDTLDGGSGSDQLNGGSGNDTLIYNVSENCTSGTKDVYTGGSGADILEIHFTLAQWLDATTQTQIAAYLAHLSAVTNAKTGDVSNGSASDFVFTFGSSTLTVQMMETLKVFVNGVVQNPSDVAVLACNDNGTATEDGPSVKIDVLHNDLVPDLVKGLALASGPAHGTATLIQPDINNPSSWYFQYQPNSAYCQYLAEGQTATDTFTYKVTDADGDTSTATVTITITGTNDAPVATGTVTGNATEDGSAVTLNALADSSDVDEGTMLTVVGLPDALPAGVGYDAATHSFTLDPSHAAYQHLAAGQTVDVTINYGVSDGIATTPESVKFTITGTNDAPVVTSNGGGATATLGVNENSTAVTTVTASDADDSATQTYSIVGGTDAARFTIDATTGALSFISAPNSEAPTDSNSDNVYNVTVRASDGVLFDDQAITVSVNDVNEFDVTAPTDTDAAANAVDENSAIGTVVGVTAHASDADATTNTVSYSLTDSAGGKFAIDSSTGVVTVAGAIDREADASLDITVRATSADGSHADQAFTIAINDVNEFAVTTPTDTDAVANAVNENVAVGTLVGITASASDADATTNAVSYSLSGNPGGLFAIDVTTGVITTAAAIDREAVGASVDITVRATSADGSHADQAFTIGVNDVNEFAVTMPTDADATANAVDENSAIGTVVGVTAFASDADATTNTVSYSLTDSAGGKFAIDSSTGVVTVAGAIDREADASLDITVRATSADGSHADQAFTIGVNDVNEFAVTTPTDTDAAANAVDENSAIGTVVGVTAFASDADATTNTVSYSLTDSAGGKFTIDSSTGVVTVAGAIDREALGASVSIGVTATSADGSTAAQSFNIAINDVDEFDVTTPTDTNVATNAVNENVAVGTLVGITASASDSDATNNGVSYSLSGNPGGLFAIDATTGVITTAAAIDREALGASVDITVRATSADTSTADQTFSIAINDVNEFAVTMPTDTDATANAVDENVAIGTLLGITASSSDADATTNAVSYSLSSNSGGLFAIDATTGVITTAAAIDREAVGASVSIEVTATSADGSTAAQSFSIAINDVDEFDVTTPTDTNVATNAVNENVAVGTLVGITASASDSDATNNGVTYSLSGNPGGLFAIDATTGVITTAAAIDREAVGASVTIEVTATSADGSTAAQSFSIAINDVDEFDVTTPTDTNVATNAVNENVAVGTLVGITASASDADATTNAVSYSLSSNPGGLFAIDATTGVVTTAAAIDREAVGASVTIEVTATSADTSTAAQSFNIAINDMNEFVVTTPTDTNVAANAINENVAVGTLVGIIASASDADATNNGVTYTLSSNPGGLFAINATTGVVTTAAAIDRETLGASVSIGVTATSADGSSAAQSFSIAINGINDNTPTITSNGAGATTSINVAENSTAVTTVTATDADLPAQTLTYSIVGGADAAMFAIDSSTGVLVFASAPNFDLPTDAGTNNVYDVTVRASDSTLFDDQAIAVTVTNVNETPTDIVFTGTPPSAGNALPTSGQILTVLSTADPDVGDTFTYRFDTDGLGTLATTASSAGTTFTLTGATLTSSGLSTNTTYTLHVRSTDAGGLFVEETLNIITGSNGGNGDTLPTGGAGNLVIAGDDILYGLGGGNGNNRDILFGGSGNDTLYGQDGQDELHGGDGKDLLYGGAGNDTFFFDTALNAATNIDTIKDFSTGSDHISLLKAGLFSNLTGSAGSTTLGADFAASQTTAGSGAEHVFYDPTTGNLYYDASAGSHADALVFATLANTNGTHPTIATTDFIIS